MKWQIVQSRTFIGEWRVEAIDYDDEGQLYVATFTGPGAKERAEEYSAFKSGAGAVLTRTQEVESE